jgi:hypothetical protein
VLTAVKTLNQISCGFPYCFSWDGTLRYVIVSLHIVSNSFLESSYQDIVCMKALKKTNTTPLPGIQAGHPQN